LQSPSLDDSGHRLTSRRRGIKTNYRSNDVTIVGWCCALSTRYYLLQTRCLTAMVDTICRPLTNLKFEFIVYYTITYKFSIYEYIIREWVIMHLAFEFYDLWWRWSLASTFKFYRQLLLIWTIYTPNMMARSDGQRLMSARLIRIIRHVCCPRLSFMLPIVINFLRNRSTSFTWYGKLPVNSGFLSHWRPAWISVDAVHIW